MAYSGFSNKLALQTQTAAVDLEDKLQKMEETCPKWAADVSRFVGHAEILFLGIWWWI